MNLPEIGATMYSVHEHFYHVPDRAAPLTEFCVCEGEVMQYYTRSYTEIKIVGKNPDGHPTPWHYKESDIGKKVFYTRDEAVQLAEHMTDVHERKWGWCDRKLRRPWRKGEKSNNYKANLAQI